MRLWAEGDLPDHKLLFSGSGSLSDAELLAIIIGSGIKDFSSMDIAKQMLGKADNNLCNFWKLSYSDLKSFTGIGKKKELRLSAFFILARRRSESDAMERIKINDSRVAAEIFKSIMVDLPYEEFWMIMLNKANVVIKKARISEGGVSGNVVYQKNLQNCS